MTLLQKQQARLNKLLERTTKKFIVIFEGRDTAGKSSTIRELEHYLPPNCYHMEPSKKPSDTMMAQWFSEWSKKLDRKEKLILLDRSYYSRALCQPINGWCTGRQYRNFMQNVLEFEWNMEKENDRKIIKFWCSISQAEQKSRIKLREVSPLKYWKLSTNDKLSLSSYDKMTIKKESVFNLDGRWNSINFENKQTGILKLITRMNDLIERDIEREI